MTTPGQAMFERRKHALVVGLALLCCAVALTLVVAADRTGSVLQTIDDRWLSWMVDVRTPWLTSAAKATSVVGGPLVMVPVRLAIIGALAWTRRWLQLAAFVGALITSELCIGPLKALIDRPRPPDALVHTSSASFPSGHAIAASVTAIGLVVVLVPAANRRLKWTVVAATFAAVMAMSRTYLGAHWLSDVIAGACFGTGLAIVWSAALEIVRARRQEHPRVPSTTGRPPGTSVQLRIASATLVSIGLVSVIALHLLRDDLDPTGHRLSEYANGPYGALMTIAFASVGTGLVAFAVALWRADQTPRWSRLVAVAVVAAGVGMVVAGIYRTEPDDVATISELIHSRASALATLALIVAAIIWSVLGEGRGIRPGRFDAPATLALASAVLGALSPLMHRSSWTGLSQRALWVTLLAWLLVSAWRLSPEATPPSR